MSVEKDSFIKDSESPEAPKDANALVEKNQNIWRLKEAVDHYRPGIDSPPFVRRTANTAINRLPVLLTDPLGVLPAHPKEANLRLCYWTPNQCFWTLDLPPWTYIVKYFTFNPRYGPHWRRWLGLQEGLETYPVAYSLKDIDEKPTTSANPNGPLAGSNLVTGHQNAVANLQETVTEEATPNTVNTQSQTNERSPTQSRERIPTLGPHSIDTGSNKRKALSATPSPQPSQNAAQQKRRIPSARVSGVSLTPDSRNLGGPSTWSSLSSTGALLGVSPPQRIEGLTQNSQATIEHDPPHEKRSDQDQTTISDDDREEEEVKRELKRQERELAILRLRKEILEAERRSEQLQERADALQAARGKREREA
ncbi:MAG: hypothetical protein Q9167_005809 [Letrouitia subvulpina]